MTFAALRARMRALDAGQLRVLVTYERAHQDRSNVVTMFERRIAKLEGTADTGTADTGTADTGTRTPAPRTPAPRRPDAASRGATQDG